MKKHLIILEGIASSGKTTIVNNLVRKLAVSNKVRAFSEDETLMSIVNDRRMETAHNLMHELLVKFENSPADFLITDRYHFSHTYRTEKNLDSVSEIENSLIKEFKAHIYLLTVDEEKIPARVQDSWNRRGEWLGKSGPIEEKTEYYIRQQQKMLELAKQSKIPVSIIDTTNMNWEEITDKIITESGLSLVS